jgi:hypothetical protein
MKAAIRKAMHHPVLGSAIYEIGDEIPAGWYDSPADFPSVDLVVPTVNPTPMPSWDDYDNGFAQTKPAKIIEADEPARQHKGWPKGKARK